MKKELLAVLILAATAQIAGAETVDEMIKRKEAAGEIKVIIGEHTQDDCDKSCDVTFTSTTDGNVVLKAGETKYFKINKTDDYTKDGGYYWKCCNTGEKSRIKGATYIKTVRNAANGTFDQWKVEIELK